MRFYVFLIVCVAVAHGSQRPNIVLIVADDMGWNDVSYHGSDQIPTPNIDALAYNGVILDRFYAQPSCTPSRAALLTGQYPIRTGFQGFVIGAGENRFLPHDVKLLPERLSELGYSTNLIGKWHLGYAYKNVTPTYRGFDYHYGYWNGVINYFDHFTVEGNATGFDMHNNLEPAWATQHQYATQVFTDKAAEVIEKHDKTKPLFLMLSHLAPHAGKPDVVYEVPDEKRNFEQFSYVEEEARRKYAGMVHELDRSVGDVVAALSQKGILNDTVIIFMSDNGAQTVGDIQVNTGSNWPLRSTKFTAFEGGVRVPACVYYSKFERRNVVNDAFMHITDLYPTLLAAAGAGTDGQTFDGVDQWENLMRNGRRGRSEILVNIDEVHQWSGLILDGFKLINGSGSFNQTLEGFYGDAGRGAPNPPYDVHRVLDSPTNQALCAGLTKDVVNKLRAQADIGNCRTTYNGHRCNEGKMCLFDVVNDPCETVNVLAEHPDVVRKLSARLSHFWNTLVGQKNQPLDPRANPIYFNNTWTTWLDI